MCQVRHKKKKKKNPGFGKNRVGRVSGNPTFFFLGLRLWKIYQYSQHIVFNWQTLIYFRSFTTVRAKYKEGV